MKSMGAFAAKTHLSQLISRVQHGERIVIQKRGKSVAALVPFSTVERARTTATRARILDGLRQVRDSAEERPKSSGAHAMQPKSLIDLGRKR